MRLQENYMLMSNRQMLEELEHRLATIQSNLSENREAYITIKFCDKDILLEKITELKSLRYRYSLFEDDLHFELIETTCHLYRNFLEATLKGLVNVYNDAYYLYHESQQKRLEFYDCAVENCRIKDHHYAMVDDTEVWQRIPDEREAPYYAWSSFGHECLEQPKIRTEHLPPTMEEEAKFYKEYVYDKDQEFYANWKYDDFDSRDKDGIDYEDWNDLDIAHS